MGSNKPLEKLIASVINTHTESDVREKVWRKTREAGYIIVSESGEDERPTFSSLVTRGHHITDIHERKNERMVFGKKGGLLDSIRSV